MKRSNADAMMLISFTLKSHPSSSPLTYDKTAWQRGYRTCTKEVAQVIATDLPTDIHGTYYRNGPSKFDIGQDKLLHPFDGDGMVIAITFKDGEAFLRNRFVHTEGYLQEKSAQRVCFRGAFRSLKPGGIWTNFLDTKIKNVANTNVIYWGKKLLALYEAGKPYELDVNTLSVMEEKESTLGGLLSHPLHTFTAHPKICAHRHHLVGMSTKQELTSCTVTFYEFDDLFQTVQQREVILPGFGFFHDFVITKNYYLLLQAPVELNVWPIVLGLKAPAESMSFHADRPAKLYLIPRNLRDEVEVVDLDPHFVFHFVNGYEPKGDGKEIVFDSFRCDNLQVGVSTPQESWWDMDYAANIPYPLLTRYSLKKGEDGKWQTSHQTLSRKALDFSTINPDYMGKKHRYCYAMTGSSEQVSSPFQAFVKIDFEALEEGRSGVREMVYRPAKHEFLGEPLFVKRRRSNEDESEEDANTEEDDGYLVSLLFDGSSDRTETSLVIFDAKDISKGPIHRVPIPRVSFPLGLHSSFAYDLTVDDAEEVIKGFAQS
eukprot:scaffold3044_cov176-Ochromonas_danica.AAC.17